MILKILNVYLIVITLLIMTAISVVAAPYASYTYDYWNVMVPAPHAYMPTQVFYGHQLGIGSLKTPQDIYATDEHIYLADTGNHRIIQMDSNWNVVRIINSFDNYGEEDSFRNPRGIYVTDNGDMYIADRENNRIVVLDQNLQLKMIITSPAEEQPDLFTSDFSFRPDKLAIDQYGSIYVISMGVYDGILEFDKFGQFQGFVGAPNVNPTVADYVWRLIGTEAQRERMRLFLPVEHSNIDVDERGFIYATATGGEIEPEEKIRRINSAGKDRLMRISTSPPVGSLPDETVSVFVDVIARENDIYTVLDRNEGHLFTYNRNGNLLYAFGAIGDVEGSFRNPAALTILDENLIVVDALKNNITVFAPTAYQELIHQAIDYYSQGNYDAATACWHQVLEYNSNYDLAYTGIGNSLLMQGDYEGAMVNYRLANDRENYSEAYRYYRKDVTEKYFGIFMAIVVVLIIYILFFATNKKSAVSVVEAKAQQAATYAQIRSWEDMQKRPPAIKLKRIWHGLRFSLKVIVSPIQGFWDLKSEKRGNLPSAFVLLFLFIVSYLIMYQYTGFMLNTRDPRALNIISESISILLPIMLWIVINWSLTTLMNGKGTFKDIFIATIYSFTPLILVLVPITIISNYLTLDEGAFYYLFLITALVWSLVLMFMGTMVIHEYSFVATLGVTILIIVGIGIALFIALLFADIVLQLFAFAGEIYREFVFRL